MGNMGLSVYEKLFIKNMHGKSKDGKIYVYTNFRIKEWNS